MLQKKNNRMQPVFFFSFQCILIHEQGTSHHTFTRSVTYTLSLSPLHAGDVRLEFGVESQVDEGSGDLHPPASP